ncbi:MAG TPA: nitroreductase family protein, partial [Pilimelia sp.]|nr:nitroreductase family protein [Pilimelia sp.]
MEFARVVRRRRMVRDYDPDRPVSPATLDALLDLAVRAPSAGFTQGWGFLVLTAPGELTRFWAAATPSDPDPRLDRWRAGLRRAPVVVVPFSSESAYLDRYAEPDKGWTDRDPARWPVPYWYVDAGMAALLLLQTAVDEGLGACFFGIPPERVDTFRAAFAVPADRLPVGAVTLGHRVDDSGAAGSPSRRRRRPAAELVHRGRWGDTGLG